MSIAFKCKMCGGALEIIEGNTTCECEYCGTTQTVPNLDNEKKTNLFNRANRLRMNNEFDKAAGIYESIVSEFTEEAEAYWGLCLCKYGIEYVDDPVTGKKIPTCHRTSFESIFDDNNFELATEYADVMAKRVYRDEAKEIDRLQKAILEIAQKEEPYDIFICYKETAEDGQRTKDSVMAQDIYDALATKGYKVFFSRITLEDKLGQEYEPYIFSALNSAKVMLAIGTDYEHFNAVWVKNEWSRFLDMMKKDKSKVLIPCYADIDAYDMPQEFKHLQGQDMGKIGFIQDLVRGVGKIIGKEEPKAAVKETVVVQQISNANIEPLLKRAFMFLEDGEWDKADDFCEQVLNLDPECAEAYLGKLMAELKVRRQDNLKNCDMPFDNKNNYSKAYKFADEFLKKKLSDYNKYIRERNETARKEDIYSKACEELQNATQEECNRLVKEFERIKDYKDSARKIKECEEKAIVCHKDSIYNLAMDSMSEDTIDSLEKAIRSLTDIADWKDSAQKIEKCKERIAELEEEKRLEEEKAERDRIAAEKAAKKKKKITDIVISSIAICIIFVVVLNMVIIPLNKYNEAMTMMSDGKYDEAIYAFRKLGIFGDSKEKISETKYAKAMSLMNEERYDDARIIFSSLGDFSDSKSKTTDCENAIKENKYQYGITLFCEGKYDLAKVTFSGLGDFNDSAIQVEKCNNAINEEKYRNAINLMEKEQYDDAITVLSEIKGYGDSNEQINKCENAINEGKYRNAINLMEKEQYDDAITVLSEIKGYGDSNEQINKCKYQSAIQKMNSGDYFKAITEFKELLNYSDSYDKVIETYKLWIKNVNVGERILFGDPHYNVLDKLCYDYYSVIYKNDKSALIVKNGGIKGCYHSEREDVTWENCSLRNMLNTSFYSELGRCEQELIQKTTITNSNNAKYGTKGGNDTEDWVFILSVDEAKKYFSSDDDREKACGYSILRTPGKYQDFISRIDSYGKIEEDGTLVDLELPRVCPAMWISLE